MKWINLLLLLSVASAFLANGTATLDSSNGLEGIGFNFNNGEVVGNEGDFYYYEGELWSNTGGLKDMGASLIENVRTCDLQDYENNLSPIEGHVYCIKTGSGSYAKIRITELTSTQLVFEWVHQRDGTNVFTEQNQSIIQEVSFNEWLIGVIVILVIIIFIVWKYH